MKFENINITGNKKRVLVAPLDWGLGHAARCIPIIYELLALQIEVIIAAEGPIKNLLKKEFPDVVFTHLKGYKIRYSSSRYWFSVKILLQFPRLLACIYAEHKALEKIIAAYKIDAVISDNRLGLYSASIPCIYITHQLQIKTSYLLGDWIAQKIHYFFINKYTACWVPDNESANNLAGILSHPKKIPATQVKYIGPLSRFKKINTEKKYDLLFMLSGPEPQRSIFEALVQREVKNYEGKVLLVRGLPGNETDELIAGNWYNLTVANHLTAEELNIAIQQSETVICRAGYTSIMDLCKLQKQAILVATPGQTEQEYLALSLMDKKLFFSVAQHEFSLTDAIKKMTSFSCAAITITGETYKTTVGDFAKVLRKNQ